MGILDDLQDVIAADDVVVDPDRLQSYRNDQAPGLCSRQNFHLAATNSTHGCFWR